MNVQIESLSIVDASRGVVKLSYSIRYLQIYLLIVSYLHNS